jgi:hypothetical protein
MARLSLCFLVVASLVYCTFAEEKYTTKFDNFDVDKVLNNNRILTNYIKCLLDEGNCTNEGRELKSESTVHNYILTLLSSTHLTDKY